MAGTWKFYLKGLKHLLAGDIKPSTTNTTIHLLTEAYVPDPFTTEFWYEISTYEVVGSGYTGGLGPGYLYWSTEAYFDPPTVSLQMSSVSWDNTTITTQTAVMVTDDGANQYVVAYLVDPDLAITNDGTVNVSGSTVVRFQVLV